MSEKILLLDAATEALSLALSHHLKNSHFEVCPQQHSQKMLPLVKELLENTNTKLSELDCIAYGRGPGSFTGVRVGVSVTQGLAFSTGLPVIGISNLQMMAQQAFETTDATSVLATIDARMGEIYIAQYKKNDLGLAECIGEEQVIKPDEFEFPSDVLMAVGTGVQTYRSYFKKDNIVINDDITLPNAHYMANIACNEFRLGNIVDAKDAQPVYVRDTVTWKKLPGKE